MRNLEDFGPYNHISDIKKTSFGHICLMHTVMFNKVQPLNSLQLLAEPVCFNEHISRGKGDVIIISNGLCMVSDALVILLLQMENVCHMHNLIL